jgi:RNA polymerase sigma-70 factor (ECF subfamily)
MPSPQIQKTENQRYKDFLQLIVEHKSRIYGYILTLVPNRASAEDLLQEVILVMWEKFHRFEPGTNFWAWSCKIAYYKVMGYRTSHSNCPVLFSDEVFSSLAEQYEHTACKPDKDKDNEKIDALETCLKRLSRRDSQIIQLRYLDKQPITTMAKSFGWSSSMMYKLMSKIHYILKECIEKKISLARSSE